MKKSKTVAKVVAKKSSPKKTLKVVKTQAKVAVKDLTPAQEETLTLKKLTALKASMVVDDSLRPKESFIELMNWASDKFASVIGLNDKSKVNKFVQNRIVVDGQFLHYCSLNNIKIDCLYNDSLISWEVNGTEKFFVQGVFKISTKNTEFIHCALFHKGNQNEDEISFFVLVSDANFESYINLRNDFDAWVVTRDRSNLHVHVVDSAEIPYTRDLTWDDLFLPEDIKQDIKSLVENFISSKEFYKKNKIPWKRGIILFGEPGNGKSSIIKTIMAQHNFKPVTIPSGADDQCIKEAFYYAEQQSPSLLYFEDIDSLFERGIDISAFLNLMDGIAAKNGLFVIATANNVNKLKSNITDRPSRFDRKYHIPLPDEKMAGDYLKKWFGELLDSKKIKELAKLSVQYDFSYAYLKELYISSMFESLSNNRKALSVKDVDKALSTLLKDKNLLNGNKSISTDKYFK